MTKFVTDYISRHGIDQLINAFAYSEHIKQQFSIFFVIAWNKTKCWKPELLSARQETFIRNLRAWCEREGIPFSYLYTVEYGKTLGTHSNFAVHLPQDDYYNDLSLFRKLVSDLDAMVPGHTGNPFTVKVLENKWTKRPQFFRTGKQRRGSLRYFMKGIDPYASFNEGGKRVRWCDHLGIDPSDQGTVIGPRYGVSQSLGAASRSATGWQELTAPAELLAAFPLTLEKRQPEQVAA
ncbi:hypothetical protein EI613_00540 [Azospirillum sp. 412522]|nr:hypothetical protein [Azospirillum sp. 412522]MBY6260412.1 hypothetical protein [Azospirillum sp. 412522]